MRGIVLLSWTNSLTNSIGPLWIGYFASLRDVLTVAVTTAGWPKGSCRGENIFPSRIPRLAAWFPLEMSLEMSLDRRGCWYGSHSDRQPYWTYLKIKKTNFVHLVKTHCYFIMYKLMYTNYPYHPLHLYLSLSGFLSLSLCAACVLTLTAFVRLSPWSRKYTGKPHWHAV